MNRFKVSSGFKSMIRKLISIEFTVILLFVLIPIVVVGSFIPQDRTFAEYTNAYGFKLASILYQTYLTSLFTSPWFFILIFLLGLNVAGCFVKSLTEKKRSLGFILVHVSLILLMAGAMISAVGRIRGQVALQEGETVSSFESNNKKIPLGFELRLKKFELQKYENHGEKLLIFLADSKKPYEFSFRPKIWTAIPGTSYQFQVEQSVLDFRFDMRTKQAFSASNEPNNPAVRVHVKGKDTDYSEWVFYRFSDFHRKEDRPLQMKYVWAPDVPKAFISTVVILEHGAVVKEQTIKVNKPLRYKGFSMYQATYDDQEQKWSGLEIVKDPGTGLVYISIIVIMAGLIWNIYVAPLLKPRRSSSSKKAN